MLSTYFRQHFDNIPKPEDLSSDEAYQLVVDSFRFLVAARLQAQNVPVENIGEDIGQILDLLLRLANYLSSYSALVDSPSFDKQVDTSIVNSANFIAAQIFEFLAKYHRIDVQPEEAAVPRNENYRKLTGLELWSGQTQVWLNAVGHYLLTGHDGNATALTRNYRSFETFPVSQSISPWVGDAGELKTYAKITTEIVFNLLESDFNGVVNLAKQHNLSFYNLSRSSDQISLIDLALVSVLVDVSQSCLWISMAMTNLIVWDTTHEYPWLEAIERAEANARHLQDPALIWFTSLLRRIFREFGKRALLLARPSLDHPPSGKWLQYLQSRAKNGRALLWRPHLEALRIGYLDLNTNCVVSMPPGAGKSFIAELKIAATLEAQERNWVLYLVPTNALARQVEADLKEALSPNIIPEEQVKRFVTDIEYNFLKIEQLPERPRGYVAVMTPEKLRLALSITPKAFETCQLCVVDEAHLIDQEKRGALLDLVLSQLRTMYPGVSFLLTSAMMSNPSDLANWLDGSYVQTQWRPTRQAMMLGIPATLLNVPNHLIQRDDILTDLYFASVYSDEWLIGEGQAKFTAIENYAHLKMSKSGFKFKATETARSCAIALASAGLKTLMFLPHVWVESSAEKIGQNINLNEETELDLDIWERLLKQETGEDQSELVERLREGVCYHKSSLHEMEQHLSEMGFSNSETIKVMVATSTLSYGMNLPVEALIFAGDKRFDPELDTQIPITAKDFANIAGRAGRPAFASQGLVQIIPNWQTWEGAETARTQYEAMRADYLAVGVEGFRIGSGLEFLLDQIQVAPPEEDLEDLASALATAWFGQSGNQELVKNTYAFHIRTDPLDEEGKTEEARVISASLAEWIREQERKLPLSDIAKEAFRRSGLPSRTCRHLYQEARVIFDECYLESEGNRVQANTFYAWFDQLVPCVQHEDCDFFFRSRVKIGNTDLRGELDVIWQYEREALIGWLKGERVAELIDSDFVKEKRPNRIRWRDRTVKFIRKTTQQYAFALGSLLLFLECVWREQDPDNRNWTYATSELDIPWEPHLLHLPLAVKWGMDSISSLIWRLMGVRFRFACRVLGELYPILNIDDQAKRHIAKLLYRYSKMYKRDPALVLNALKTRSQNLTLDYDDDLLGNTIDACFAV